MQKATSLKPFLDAKAAAEKSVEQIEEAAGYLARLMERAYGRPVRVQIDHEDGFLMIVTRADRRPLSPVRRALV